jgi:ribosomal protein L31E
VARTPVSEIPQAIEAVKELKDVVARHAQALDKLITLVQQMEARLKVLEDGARKRA